MIGEAKQALHYYSCKALKHFCTEKPEAHFEFVEKHCVYCAMKHMTDFHTTFITGTSFMLSEYLCLAINF